jgi:hypothetical protein
VGKISVEEIKYEKEAIFCSGIHCIGAHDAGSMLTAVDDVALWKRKHGRA